jgi:uncharacterized protein (DUF1697 family)
MATYRYAALLRALNVGGHAVTTMADVRAQLEGNGLVELATVGASGNLVFAARSRDGAAIGKRIAAALAKPPVGYAGTVFVRGADELARAARGNPLPKDAAHHCHVVFLSAPPDAARRRALLALADDSYRFAFASQDMRLASSAAEGRRGQIDGAVLYFAYPRVLAGKRRAFDFERLLGVSATARTWRVVDELVARTHPPTAKR